MTPPVELPQCQKLSEAETLTLWELLAAHFTLIAEQLENRIAAADAAQLALLDVLSEKGVLDRQDLETYLAAARKRHAGQAVDAVFQPRTTALLDELRGRLRASRASLEGAGS